MLIAEIITFHSRGYKLVIWNIHDYRYQILSIHKIQHLFLLFLFSKPFINLIYLDFQNRAFHK